MYNALVSTQWLEDHVNDPKVVVLEVSIDTLADAGYTSGHVPTAQFVYWKDLLWHDSDREFASAQVIAARLSALGIDDESTVALVGDPFQFAAYAYWVMTMAGQGRRCRLVDGGRRTWLAEDRPLSTTTVKLPTASLAAGKLDSTSRIGRDELRQNLGTGGQVVIDMRSHEEYDGERVSPPWLEFDHGAERRGHIPGARHLFFGDLLSDDGTLLQTDELLKQFEAVGAITETDVVAYCRLSHRASLAWFVLTRLLGRSNVRVYDGSWTEWGSIVGFPVER